MSHLVLKNAYINVCQSVYANNLPRIIFPNIAGLPFKTRRSAIKFLQELQRANDCLQKLQEML